MFHRLSELMTSGFLNLLDAAWQRISGANGVALLLLWSTVLFAAMVTYARAPPGPCGRRVFPSCFTDGSAAAPLRAGGFPVLAVAALVDTAAGAAACAFHGRGGSLRLFGA